MKKHCQTRLSLQPTTLNWRLFGIRVTNVFQYAQLLKMYTLTVYQIQIGNPTLLVCFTSKISQRWTKKYENMNFSSWVFTYPLQSVQCSQPEQSLGQTLWSPLLFVVHQQGVLACQHSYQLSLVCHLSFLDPVLWSLLFAFPQPLVLCSQLPCLLA